MLDRGRQIAKMMGYDTTDALLKAIGEGNVIIIKLPQQERLDVAEWMREQMPQAQAEDAGLAEALDEIASGLEFAMELKRYPADSDICNMDLPHGWPSYCERNSLD